MSYSTLESEEQERKLFIGGLNKVQTDEESVRQFFSKYGGIIDCTIMRDNDKNSRGFGFILFEHASTVDDIINTRKEGKAFVLDDHHIEVKRALPKVPGGSATRGSSGLYRKIFVGGLPSTITDDELRKYFERFGRVTEIELLRDRETNRLRGFAFITFDDEDAADKCIQRKHHEICKKLCEVKRAQTRSTLNKFEEEDYHGGRGGNHRSRGDSRGGGHDERHHQNSGFQTPSSLGITEVNQLIQQAFIMGQQSVMGHQAIQPPTAASLLGQLQTPQYTPQSGTNPLLQALMNQSAPIGPAQPQPIVQPSAAPGSQAGNNNAALNQLAQLLQGRGIDANALSALLKPEDGSRQQPSKTASNGGYSTTYPSSSTYDMYYNQPSSSGSYAASKDDQDSKRYRPY